MYQKSKKTILKERSPEIGSFVIYVIVSFIVGSLLIPYCEPYTGDGIDVRESYKPIVIIFVLIPAIVGPISFFYKTKLTPVAMSIVIGLGSGLGFFTIYALITNLECVETVLAI